MSCYFQEKAVREGEQGPGGLEEDSLLEDNLLDAFLFHLRVGLKLDHK